MIIFLCSQDVHITPPGCLDAYSASWIVGSKPTETSLAAWKVTKGLSLTPFLFAYTPRFQKTCLRSARHRFEYKHEALSIFYRYGGSRYPQALPLSERFGWPGHNRNALASHTHQDHGFPHLWIKLSG